MTGCAPLAGQLLHVDALVGEDALVVEAVRLGQVDNVLQPLESGDGWQQAGRETVCVRGCAWEGTRRSVRARACQKSAVCVCVCVSIKGGCALTGFKGHEHLRVPSELLVDVGVVARVQRRLEGQEAVRVLIVCRGRGGGGRVGTR